MRFVRLARAVMVVGAGVTLFSGCGHTFSHTYIVSRPFQPQVPLRVDPAATFYIARPTDGTHEGKAYERSGELAQGAVGQALRTRGGQVREAPSAESVDAALASARAARQSYLVVPEIRHWEDRATEWSGKRDIVDVRVSILEPENGQLIDAVDVRGISRWGTLGGDHPQELLPAPLSEYAATLGRPRGGSAPRIDELAVELAGDERELKQGVRFGASILFLLPLVPYGTQRIAPEQLFSAFPEDLLARSLAELRDAGIARVTLRSGDQLPGVRDGGAAYKLRLTLEEGVMKRRITLYGLSFIGAFPVMFGAPAAFDSVELRVRCELLDPSGSVLGSEVVSGESHWKEGLFYNAPASSGGIAIEKSFASLAPALRRFVESKLPVASGSR